MIVPPIIVINIPLYLIETTYYLLVTYNLKTKNKRKDRSREL